MGEFDFMEKLYSFARDNGYRLENINIGDRRNKRGFYKYVTLALIVPGKENEHVEAPTSDVKPTSEEITDEGVKVAENAPQEATDTNIKKDEVINNEV